MANALQKISRSTRLHPIGAKDRFSQDYHRSDGFLALAHPVALSKCPAVPPLIEFRYAVNGEEDAGDTCWYPPTVAAYAADEREGDCRGAPDPPDAREI